MRNLMSDKATADLTIFVGMGRCPISAHRGVLVARSDYFRGLLRSGFAEASESSISIPDVSPDAFAVLLEFVYTGCIHDEIAGSIVGEVLHLSSRFCMPGLTAICELRMKALVTLANVDQVYGMARGANAAQLKRFCLYYGKKVRVELEKRATSGGADTDPRRAQVREKDIREFLCPHSLVSLR